VNLSPGAEELGQARGFGQPADSASARGERRVFRVRPPDGEASIADRCNDQTPVAAGQRVGQLDRWEVNDLAAERFAFKT
jgi:hypothetical protein